MEITHDERVRMKTEFYLKLWENNENAGRHGFETIKTYVLDQYGKVTGQDLNGVASQNLEESDGKSRDTQKSTRIVHLQKYFEVVFEAHLKTGHGGHYAMYEELRKTVDVPMSVINLLPDVCRVCKPVPEPLLEP